MPALPVVSATMRWYKPSLLYEESPNPGFYRASYDKAEGSSTEAGLSVTTRRIVAPKSGPAGQKSGGSDRRVDAEGYLSTIIRKSHAETS